MVRYLHSLCLIWIGFLALSQAQTIRVVVWDERQPEQRQAYPNFLGNKIASHLQELADLSVVSVSLDDPQKGISPRTLEQCDVLIWWGHRRNNEITSAEGKEIVRRIQQGQLAMISLHSAHWSTPFIEAMNERTTQDALGDLPARERDGVRTEYVHPQLYEAPERDALPTPRVSYKKFPDGSSKVLIHLPNCCFPAYRGDGKPSHVFTLLRDHPIAHGIPARFQISQTEMYDEPFHVPEPDAVVFEERWPAGEWFRSGCLWRIGRGEIFYFRPGHESFGVFNERLPLKILENAVRYLAENLRGSGG